MRVTVRDSGIPSVATEPPRDPKHPRSRLPRARTLWLGEAADGRRDANNFDLLRLAAAICVVLAHSFDLLRSAEPFPLLKDINWGFVGVLVFFSISGFLVARSWARNPRLLPFAIKRALRLIPGLLVALLLTALVLGPLVTTATLGSYLRDPSTKAYVLNNVIMQSDYVLPDVFAHTTYPLAVNGSLWTLPLEVKAYIFVALVGLIGLLTRRRYAMFAVVIVAVLACVDSLRASIPLGNHAVATLIDIQAPQEIVNKLRLGIFTSYPDMFAAFAVGSALYALRKSIPLRWDVAALAGLLISACAIVGGQAPELAAVGLGPYIVLCLAYLTPGFVRLPRRFGDYSYGVYIYAFPVQQTLSYLIGPLSPWLMFLAALPVTFALAVLSWHFVERPSLEMKRRLAGAEPPAGTLSATSN